jgi:hypothetical protein
MSSDESFRSQKTNKENESNFSLLFPFIKMTADAIVSIYIGLL